MAPLRLCFVCLGNICRSPSAAVLFTSMLEHAGVADAVQVSSAGTSDWHAGEGIDPRAGEALLARGYDGSRHVAKTFSAADLRTHDLVLAMDRENERALRRLAATAASRRPAGGRGPAATAPTADRLGEIRLLRSYDPEAVRRGQLDVPDPYYGGPHGFERVLDILERACRGLLDDVVGRLRR